MNPLSLYDADIHNKTVLLRADLDVALERGRVTDRARIGRCASTVAMLVERGAMVVVMAHLGRPKGVDHALTLRVVAHELEEALKRPVTFIEHSVGATAESAVRALQSGDVALLENLRFHAAEDDNDRVFAMRLSMLGDIHVNDVPSTERKLASVHAIREFLPSYAGPQTQPQDMKETA